MLLVRDHGWLLGAFFVFNLPFGYVGCSLLCAQAFSSCSEWGLLFVAVHGLLIAVAFLVAERRLQ